jgi:GMP reductase
MASNMDATGTIAMAKALAWFKASGSLSKFIDTEMLAKFFSEPESRHSFLSMGITGDELERLRAVNRRVAITKVSIEVANGYIEALPKFVAEVRREFPKAVILAGSVCTPEGTINILKAGADITRVGIGSGSVCINPTRDRGRLPAVIGRDRVFAGGTRDRRFHLLRRWMHSARRHLQGVLWRCRLCHARGYAGRTQRKRGPHHVQAIGRKEAPGEHGILRHGFGCRATKHYGARPRYEAAEGKRVSVPYRGPVANTLCEILGGLRSMMTYIGAADMAAIPRNARFVRVGRQLNNVFGDSRRNRLGFSPKIRINFGSSNGC